MRKILSVFIITILLAGLASPALATGGAELDAAVNGTAAFMLNTVRNPEVGTVGGEWAVIGLARSGFDVPDSYFENYYRNVERYVRERGAILHNRRYTDNSRVILGLTAAGFDPRDVAGYDLTAPLEDFEATIWQGINGPIWALIALDSMNYPNSQRDNFIAEILRRELTDGGWNLTGGRTDETKTQDADADLTGMALQALAKYQDRPDVKAATDRALAMLSRTQDANGGFSSSFSGEATTLESAAQVLVALTELGVPVTDPRFVKNGNTVLDNVMSYRNADGSFVCMREGPDGNNQMSAEQAFNALVAAQRAMEPSRNSLYRMSDTVRRGEFAPLPAETGLPGKHDDVSVRPVTQPNMAFTDAQGHPNQAAIEALAAREIINGRSDTIFDPDATMTRAEFAAIVTRSLGLPEKTFPPFADVPASAWFANPVATAFYYEIITGRTPTAFDPNGTITRQEAAVMVARAASLAGMDTARTQSETRDTLAKFGDYRTVASWAQASLAFIYDVGILDDAEFDINPGEPILRSEIAEMLHRMLNMANLM